MRVLVVENDDRVARALVRVLRQEGHAVERTGSLRRAGEILQHGPFDLVLVDLGLDDGDGVDLVRELRDRPDTGVIIVTARGAESDRVRGLRAGADDYLVKPFGAGELSARIEAVTRRLRVARSVPAEQGILRHGPLAIDMDRHEAGLDGEVVTTTRKEFEVLTLLVRSSGNVVARQHLLDQVWQVAQDSSSRSLDTHMASLRGKFGSRLAITTVRGVGYRLEKPGSDPGPPAPDAAD